MCFFIRVYSVLDVIIKTTQKMESTLTQNIFFIIIAFKKHANIPNQLVKKLNGITLIQRAINVALNVTSTNNILMITDSEEISLIAERNEVKYFYNPKLDIPYANIFSELKKLDLLKKYINNQKDIIIYQSNTPVTTYEEIIDAYIYFQQTSLDKMLVSGRNSTKKFYENTQDGLKEIKTFSDTKIFEEIDMFKMISSNFFKKNVIQKIPYIIPAERSIEIKSYQDWWIYEKILSRKKIIFNVLGSLELGMGHIYHALSLAHDINDHEIIFVCHETYEIAVEKIAEMDYKVISTNDTLKTILELKPNLVINDILNTSKEYMETLKNNQIKTINFEDLGEGASYADLVINELYDTPKIAGSNFLWGYKYVTLRDEFEEAIPHTFSEKIDEVLITFGGTDQNNLTHLTLKAILPLVEKENIKVHIVCGGGYLYKTELLKYLEEISYKNIEFTSAIGVISKIMEKTQIAFSSNGRTVYELADMHIPSIIISHHERETTHTFTTLENGFMNLGVYQQADIAELIKNSFNKIILDHDYRKLLFLNIKKYNFRKNKYEVLDKILTFL